MHEAGIKVKGYSKCTNKIPFTRNTFNSQDSRPLQIIVCKQIIKFTKELAIYRENEYLQLQCILK